MANKICFISNRYPNITDPSSLVFLQQLIWALTDLGEECTVICPIPNNLNVRTNKEIPKKTIERTANGKTITVYFPRYLSFGQQKVLKWNTAKINEQLFTRCVENVIKTENISVDAFYGHFISPAGIAAVKMGKKYKKPSFIAYGESTPWSVYNLGIDYVRKALSDVTGVIAVSSKNKNELTTLKAVEESKITVIPNAIDPNRFYQKNRLNLREKHGIEKNATIVSFVGQFIKRKGIIQLDNTVDKFDDVYAMYAGKGKIIPKSDKTYFHGPIEPAKLIDFYNISDFFVLPTENEGCSNAIIEAIACGLPIISSNLPFNDEILDETNSIRIDVSDEKQLFDAITLLNEDTEYRKQLSEGSLKKAKELTIQKRAHKIREFIIHQKVEAVKE